MRFEAALRAAQEWSTMIELHLNLGEEPVNDMWLEAGTVDGSSSCPFARRTISRTRRSQ
jgi:hypothetical protein